MHDFISIQSKSLNKMFSVLKVCHRLISCQMWRTLLMTGLKFSNLKTEASRVKESKNDYLLL